MARSETISRTRTKEGKRKMNVKHLFDYVEQCKNESSIPTWEGLKNYYENMKGRY